MSFVALLLAGVVLLGGCGYSLEASREDPEAPDPITVLGRDLRQFKAQHRVSIFDLKNDQKVMMERTKADVEKVLAELQMQIQRDLGEAEKKRAAALLSLRRQNADFGEKIAEIELQLRMMVGNIEEEMNRYRDASEQTQDNALRELGNIKRLMASEIKEKKASLKMLKSQITEEKRQREVLKNTVNESLLAQVKVEEGGRKTLQEQINQIKSSNVTANASSNEQIKALNQVSTQVDQLIEKVLPAVNQLAERLDNQEEKLSAVTREIDIDDLNRKLGKLTDTIEVQRQSLDMLGNTLTAEVDKQKHLLQENLGRLKALELQSSK